MINKIAVWGDSILKGVVLDPQTGRYVRLKDNCCVDVVSQQLHIPIENHAKFGLTSEKGKVLLESRLQKEQSCDVAVLCFGGNDVDHNWAEIAEHPQEENPPHVKPERFAANLREMVQAVREKGIRPVLMTLPPIDARRYFNWLSKGIAKPQNILRWLGDVSTIFRHHAQYSGIVKQTAEKERCDLVDIRSAFLNQPRYSDFLCLDGIHPNAQGHELMEREFLRFASQTLHQKGA